MDKKIDRNDYEIKCFSFPKHFNLKDLKKINIFCKTANSQPKSNQTYKKNFLKKRKIFCNRLVFSHDVKNLRFQLKFSYFKRDLFKNCLIASVMLA